MPTDVLELLEVSGAPSADECRRRELHYFPNRRLLALCGHFIPLHIRFYGTRPGYDRCAECLRLLAVQRRG